jgi:ATP-dependent helicase IRC3
MERGRCAGIVIDEAHHASATTYTRILDYFGARDPSSHVMVWGCSATVRRHDGVSLGDVFEQIG